MNLTKSQVVFVEIDPEDFLHMILDGKIKLGTTSNDGRESMLTVLGCRTFSEKV